MVIALTGDEICVAVARAEVLDVVVHGGRGHWKGGEQHWIRINMNRSATHGAESAEFELFAGCPDPHVRLFF